MDDWLPFALLAMAPFGYFSLIIPGVMGYLNYSFWFVVAHAAIASLFAGTGGINRKLQALSDPSRRTNHTWAIFWLLIFPAAFAMSISFIFYSIGRFLN